jgi:ribosomal-protein-alanine N-acetyltransferase
MMQENAENVMGSKHPMILQSDRLVLRWLNPRDVTDLYRIYSDPGVMRYWATSAWTELAQATQLVAEAMLDYENGTDVEFGIERRSDGLLLGTCNLFHFQPDCRRAEIAYALGRDFWGYGYMEEALTTLINYAFQDLGLIRLEADIDSRNHASIKLLERLHFQPEGLLRHRWIVAGEISDTAFYGLLQQDWTAGRLTKFAMPQVSAMQSRTR